MALHMCPECSEAVSEHAPSCPHCGFAGKKPAAHRSRGAIAAIAGACLIAGGGLGWTVRAHVSSPAITPSAPAAAPDCNCDDDDRTDDDNDNDDDAVDTRTPFEQAQDAYVHGQYATAIDLAKPLIDSDPARAWRITGAAACFEKDRTTARKAYAKLDERGREFLKYVCSRNAIRLP
jgi:hypothetical protein